MSEKYPQWYELPGNRWDENPHKRCFRDSQRQKLYDAEQTAKYYIENLNLNPSFSSIEEIQKFINKFITSAWFKKRFKKIVCTVKKARTNSKTARGGYGYIILPFWAWNKVVVLHELTHVINKFNGCKGTSHGRFFACAFLELIGHVLGPKAKEILKKQYKKGKVKYTPKRNLTEKDREARRKRFIKNVLKGNTANV